MHNYLRLDGVFCMRLILKNTNDAIGTYAGPYFAYQHVNRNVGNFCKFLERIDLTACVASRCTSYSLLTQYYGLFCVSIITRRNDNLRFSHFDLWRQSEIQTGKPLKTQLFQTLWIQIATDDCKAIQQQFTLGPQIHSFHAECLVGQHIGTID